MHFLPDSCNPKQGDDCFFTHCVAPQHGTRLSELRPLQAVIRLWEHYKTGLFRSYKGDVKTMR